MDEFEAIALYALKDLELPEELSEESKKRLKSQLVTRFALILFWDRRLTLNGIQQRLGVLKVEIENQIIPSNGYGNYIVGSDLDRIRREYQGGEV